MATSPKKNKNKNNFILHRNFKITNTSCQLFIDEMIFTIYTHVYRVHYDKTLHKLHWHLGPSHDIIKVLKVSRSTHILISVGTIPQMGTILFKCVFHKLSY